jgi:hypothetical protein
VIDDDSATAATLARRLAIASVLAGAADMDSGMIMFPLCSFTGGSVKRRLATTVATSER